MIIKVNPHRCEIVKEPVNEKEINITKCSFEFDEEITQDYVKEAYFTLDGTTYKQIIVNNECNIPYEVLEKEGQIELGVVAYLVEDEETIKRYNPSPCYFKTLNGSLKNAENTEPITPSEMEQYEQALQDGLTEVNEKLVQIDNLDIDVSKSGTIATVTITKKDGTEKSVEIYDGEQGEQGVPGANGKDGKDATINGVNTLNMIAGSNITINQSGSTLTISSTGGGGGGTSDYQALSNKPSINSVELFGNKTSSDLGVEDVTNKVTSLSSASTDTQYPSAKCVYDLVGNINTALDTINGEVI